MRRPTGQADAGAQVHGLLLQAHGQRQRGGHALRHYQRLCTVAARQQQGEFVARQSRHHVAGAQSLRFKPRPDGLEQQVAKGKAHHIVDVLEAVEVEHGHDAGLAAGDGLLQRGAELRAVGQAGEPVPVGQLADLLFMPGDVHAHAVEGARQFADLVLPLDVLQAAFVFAAAQPLAGAG